MRLFKEMLKQMRSDFTEWADGWLVPLFAILLIAVLIIVSMWALGLLLATSLLDAGAIGTILMCQAVVEIMLSMWVWRSYQKAARKIKDENKALLRSIKDPGREVLAKANRYR